MSKFVRRISIYTTGMLLASIAAMPASAIVSESDSYDYWHQALARDYPQVVQMWGFETTLEKDGSLADGDLTYGIGLNNFATSVSSAVLINEQWVATAAHSVIEEGWFQFDIGGEAYSAAQWFIPAGTQDAGGVGQPETVFGEDIAFVRLDRPVTNVAPRQLHRGEMNLKDREFTVVGYGTYETLDGSGAGPAGVKRAARNRYDIDQPGSIVSGSLFLMHDMDSELLIPTPEPGDNFDPEADFPLVLEGSTRPGDSGGGEFVAGYLTGITSFGFTINDNAAGIETGDYGASTDVSRFAGLFDDLLSGIGISTNSTPTGFGLEFGIPGFSISDIRDDDDLPTWFFTGSPAIGINPIVDGNGYIVNPVVDISPTTGELVVIGPRSEDIVDLTADQWAAVRAAAQAHIASTKLQYKDMSFQDEMGLALVEAILSLQQVFGDDVPFTFSDNVLGALLGSATDEYDPDTDGTGPGSGAPLMAGDLNRDGYVDDLDLAILLGHWGQDGSWTIGNLRLDDTIDDLDLALLLGNWTGSPTNLYLASHTLIPEPASAMLLSVGSWVLLRRNRRRSRCS